MRRLALPVAVALAASVTAEVASAHRVDVGSVTAPVPLSLLYAGAAATVALTAAWLGAGDRFRVGTGERTVLRVGPTATRRLRRTARAGALGLFATALVHGVVGPATPAENLATLVVWPLFVKGVAVVAVFAGSTWRVLSPWETLYDLLVFVEGDEVAVLGTYPERLARWPAVLGFVAGIGVLENLTVATRSPSTTVAVAAAYAVVMLAGGVAFGRQWFERADALTVLFDLLGRASVLRARRTASGGTALSVRPPWSGSVDRVADRSVAVFVVAAVYTVSFDGFTATAVFQDALFDARSALGAGVADVALYLAGLCGFVASYLLAAALADRLAGGGNGDGARGEPNGSGAGPPSGPVAFAGSVVPIAAAYEVAHNYTYVAANAGQVATVVRDAALAGNGAAVSPLGWLPVSAFWLSQVGLVVGGHLVAVVAAHLVATRRYGTASRARRGHAPLVAVMVGYTVLSLWIVSRPVAA